VIASFLAAVPIGLVGMLMERRNLAPPMVVSIAGIVPLLPGLALLHGIYAILNDQHAVGFRVGVGCAGDRYCARGRRHARRVELLEGSAARHLVRRRVRAPRLVEDDPLSSAE